MRTVTFQSVLNGIAQLLGMVPSRDLNAARAGALTEYANQRILEGWRFDFWPEWTVVEQRYYRAAYDAAANVVATDEVFHIGSQTYYQALRAQTPAAQAPALYASGTWTENSAWWAASSGTYTASDWATATVYVVGDKVREVNTGLFYQCHTAHTSGGSFDATKFGVLTPFDKYVAYEQEEQTPIDQVKRVCRRNPRVNPTNPGEVGFAPSNAGVQVDFRAPAVVWVEFRLRPPQFTSTPWSATTTYATGNLVYWSATGETYKALQASVNNDPTFPAYWEKVDFPAILSSYVKRAAMADALKDQKQTDRSVEETTEALNELADALDRELDAAGQYPTAQVVTYGR